MWQHSRAYLNHLIKAHEPVASSLLTVRREREREKETERGGQGGGKGGRMRDALDPALTPLHSSRFEPHKALPGGALGGGWGGGGGG